MINNKIILIVSIFIIGFVASTTHAKRGEPKPVNSVSKDGIEYAAPLDPNQMGFVTATWQRTNRVIWSRQIYTIKYEYKRGLERDVQWCFISKMRFANDKLIISNEKGYEYELDLNSLDVKVLNGHSVVDNTNWPHSK